LIGVGLGSAAVEAAAGGDAALDDSEHVAQKRGVDEGEGEGVLTHGRVRFQETAVGKRPATHQKEPVLDNHRAQVDEDLREDTPGVGAARLINVAVSFPQFKKEFKEVFDVPAGGR